MTVLIFWLAHRAADLGFKKARSIDLELRDDPHGEGECLVEIHLYLNGVLWGEDRGSLFIENQCLYFYGHRSTFLIGRQDLRQPWTTFHALPIEQHPGEGSRIDLLHPECELAIMVSPIATSKKAAQDEAKRIVDLVDQFRQSTTRTSLTRVYPPVTRDPLLPGIRAPLWLPTEKTVSRTPGMSP